MFNWRQRVIVILLAVLVGAGIGYLQIRTQTVVMQDAPAPAKADPSAAIAGLALTPAFSLTDQTGKNVTQASWPGQYLLIYFGFTHCPDVCPLGLGKMSDALNALPEATAAQIQPLFITIDPDRDTVASMKEYVPLFHKRLLGLSGTQAQVDEAIKNFRVYAQKQIIDGDTKNYMMNHSSYTYLITPDGKLADVYAHEATSNEMAAKLKERIKS